MSTNEDCSELKAGHPPAVKVGSMRITQHKPTHEKPPETKKEEPKTEEDNETEEAPPTIAPKQTLLISGALAKGDEDFPAEAIKAFHEKPAPSHEYRNLPKKGQHIIQQPRK